MLRFDDRGAGSSSGLFGELRTPEADALDAVAPLAATMTAEVSFVVLLGAPAIDAALGAVTQHEAIGRARGRSEASLAFEKRVRTRIYEILDSERDDARARAAITSVIAEATRQAGPDDLPWLIDLKRAFNALALPRYSTTFRQRLSMGPAHALRAVRVPVLALFAELDVQVTAEPNVAVMREALGESSPLTEIRDAPGPQSRVPEREDRSNRGVRADRRDHGAGRAGGHYDMAHARDEAVNYTASVDDGTGGPILPA